MPDMTGKVAIITGPTIGGVGFESAVSLAAKGAHVILAGRNQKKGEAAMAELRLRAPFPSAEFMLLDLGSLKSVKAFATAFKAKKMPLHILLNNAGIMAVPFSLTEDGYESQWATNHLGHFLLTKLLLPELEASAPSRIVTVSSLAGFFPNYLAMSQGMVDHVPAMDFTKLGADYGEGYVPFVSYGRSKFSNILFTQALARRLKDKKIYANVCHPGGIKTNLAAPVRKDLITSMGETFTYYLNLIMESAMMSPKQGAVTQLYLATAPEIETQDIRGKYYKPQALMADPPGFATEEKQEELWKVSEKCVADFL